MTFRDPRRFGGVLPFPSAQALQETWNRTLGPDALSIADDHLYQVLREDRTARRPIKAALLDQRILAGVGNIYADEALFRAAIRPSANTARLSQARLARLTHHIREILAEAIAAGGSSLRDYADAMNNPGAFVHRHQVYGRQGLPCTICQNPLKSTTIAQRTTVYCAVCQNP
jgi:formamidopyrimidine-DNA glycosylase